MSGAEKSEWDNDDEDDKEYGIRQSIQAGDFLGTNIVHLVFLVVSTYVGMRTPTP